MPELPGLENNLANRHSPVMMNHLPQDYLTYQELENSLANRHTEPYDICGPTPSRPLDLPGLEKHVQETKVL